MLLVRAKCFRKKLKFKTALITSFILLLGGCFWILSLSIFSYCPGILNMTFLPEITNLTQACPSVSYFVMKLQSFICKQEEVQREIIKCEGRIDWPKLWLIFCCHQQKIFKILTTITLVVNVITRQMTSFSWAPPLWVLSVGILSFCFLTHFMPLISFDTRWKHQKTRDFLMFSGGNKRDHWYEMGWDLQNAVPCVLLLY